MGRRKRRKKKRKKRRRKKRNKHHKKMFKRFSKHSLTPPPTPDSPPKHNCLPAVIIHTQNQILVQPTKKKSWEKKDGHSKTRNNVPSYQHENQLKFLLKANTGRTFHLQFRINTSNFWPQKISKK